MVVNVGFISLKTRVPFTAARASPHTQSTHLFMHYLFNLLLSLDTLPTLLCQSNPLWSINSVVISNSSIYRYESHP